MSYVYAKPTNGRAKFPVIVTKTKYILPPSKQQPNRRVTRGKASTNSSPRKLSSLAIIDSLSSVKKVPSKDGCSNSVDSVRKSKMNGQSKNGHYKIAYPGYPYSFSFNDGNNHSLNSSLLSSSSPNEKKLSSDRGSGASRETDSDKMNHSKSVSVCDGNMMAKKSHHGHNHSDSKKSKKKLEKKKKKKREWQSFVLRILLVVNIITLLLAVVSLIMAGIIDPQPLHHVGTTGAQLSLASIFVIFASLLGLYGSRLKNYRLLFIYSYCLIAELIFRSVVALIYVFFYHNGSRLYVSMVSVIPEVALIFLALAVALDLKQKQKMKIFQSHVKTIPV